MSCKNRLSLAVLMVLTACSDDQLTEPELSVSAAAARTFTFEAIAAGENHSCTRRLTVANSSSITMCWGANNRGQVGTGATTLFYTTPVQVVNSSGLNGAMHTLAAGKHSTCGLRFGSNPDACWGENEFGQLGNNSLTDSRVPVSIVNAPKFTWLTVGQEHACGLTSPNSLLYCWGRGSEGQLGNGSTANRTTPTLVSGGLQVHAVSAGAFHTCAVVKGSPTTVYCWGSNSNLQLGSSGGTALVPRKAVTVGGFRQIAAGRIHTCGMTDLGKVYCWGSGLYGQNGNADGLHLPFPNDNTSGPHQVSSTTFKAVTVGWDHSCALRASDGQAYCWGRNTEGQSGPGVIDLGVRSPRPVANTFKYDMIVGGGSHTIARATTGALIGWGWNSLGQLGNGTTTTASSPIIIVP